MEPLEIDSFSRHGEYWRVHFAGRTHLMRHSKGLDYLSTLVHAPRTKFSVAQLVGIDAETADPVKIESARLRVTKSIKAAIRRIGDENPELAYHLRAGIHTGRSCCYEPPPRGGPTDTSRSA